MTHRTAEDRIIHERTLALVFNYAYETGDGLVSDAIYEYGILQLRMLKASYPEEWNSCEFFKDYFVERDDWEYTGSGVPRTEEVHQLYLDYLERQRKWKSTSGM